MNVCELNKFIDLAGDTKIDCYNFNPTTEKATISKGENNVVIDLNLSNVEQLSLFQLFLDELTTGD
jgi:hypothetical protein